MRGRRSGRQPDYERRRQAAELRQQGLTFAEIARRLGITPRAARRLVLLAAGRRPGDLHPCSACSGPLPGGGRGGRCPACVAADPAAAFPERLRALRQAAGLTRRELATQAGMGVGTLAAYEQGRRRPVPQTLADLARVLGPGLVGDAPA
jgi:transcriptional regulator with XRE-family HTH domain